eukprot:498539-Prymnesium_polylepis.1
MHGPVARAGHPLLRRRRRRRRRLRLPRRARGVSWAGRRRRQALERWRLPLRRSALVALQLIRLERRERLSRSLCRCGLGVRRSCGRQQRRHDERRCACVCCRRLLGGDRPQKGTP